MISILHFPPLQLQSFDLFCQVRLLVVSDQFLVVAEKVRSVSPLFAPVLKLIFVLVDLGNEAFPSLGVLVQVDFRVVSSQQAHIRFVNFHVGYEVGIGLLCFGNDLLCGLEGQVAILILKPLPVFLHLHLLVFHQSHRVENPLIGRETVPVRLQLQPVLFLQLLETFELVHHEHVNVREGGWLDV